MDEFTRQPHSVVLVVRVEPSENVANKADLHWFDRKSYLCRQIHSRPLELTVAARFDGFTLSKRATTSDDGARVNSVITTAAPAPAANPGVPTIMFQTPPGRLEAKPQMDDTTVPTTTPDTAPQKLNRLQYRASKMLGPKVAPIPPKAYDTRSRIESGLYIEIAMDTRPITTRRSRPSQMRGRCRKELVTLRKTGRSSAATADPSNN